MLRKLQLINYNYLSNLSQLVTWSLTRQCSTDRLYILLFHNIAQSESWLHTLKIKAKSI